MFIVANIDIIRKSFKKEQEMWIQSTRQSVNRTFLAGDLKMGQYSSIRDGRTLFPTFSVPV